MGNLTEKELERVEFYSKKYNFSHVVAVWAALHENLPEFRELKFYPETGTIMPEPQKKRDPDFLEDVPCPAWVSVKDYNSIKRYYWREHLPIKDCATLMNKTEQEVRTLVHEIKSWSKSKNMVKCTGCGKFHNETTLFTSQQCEKCYKESLKKVYQ